MEVVTAGTVKCMQIVCTLALIKLPSPAYRHSGQLAFLPSNQQHQSTQVNWLTAMLFIVVINVNTQTCAFWSPCRPYELYWWHLAILCYSQIYISPTLHMGTAEQFTFIVEQLIFKLTFKLTLGNSCQKASLLLMLSVVIVILQEHCTIRRFAKQGNEIGS